VLGISPNDDGSLSAMGVGEWGVGEIDDGEARRMRRTLVSQLSS